jgi:AraC family transcriptional regulator
MDPRAIETVIAKRFRLPQAPSFVGRIGVSKLPVPITHLKSVEARPVETMAVPYEQSFSFQVPLTSYRWRAWFSGKEKIVPPAMPGNVYLFDLSNNPTVRQNTAFSTVRFNISQAALTEYAYEHGLRKPNGLYAPALGCPDPIMSSLAQTMVTAMERPREGTNLFVDYMALAFCAHILITYGGVPVRSISMRRGLAPWQLRRACEFIEANLDRDPSIVDIAAECGLSSSYFAKAFRQALGMPPHAWLSMRRIERAKKLLVEENLELSEIAVACGFVDQSHLSRTFVKIEGCSPGKWRRSRRN